MNAPAAGTWLVAGYALALLGIAWSFDAMARRTSARAAQWQTGEFAYHEDHDAWKCPEDQWLWPTSFDPDNRVMRYRAKPSVCNACPVRDTCTTSTTGREVSRAVDPWPHSEAGRFHRGIACVIVGLAGMLILGQALIARAVPDLLVLAAALILVGVLAAPLFTHLVHSPADAPEHLPTRTAHEDSVAAAIDKYSTRWGTGLGSKESKNS